MKEAMEKVVSPILAEYISAAKCQIFHSHDDVFLAAKIVQAILALLSKGDEEGLMTDEDIGNLEWNSTDLEMFYYEQFAEAHLREAKAILKAQQALAKRLEREGLLADTTIDIPDQVFLSSEAKQCGFTKRSFLEAGWRKVKEQK